MNVREKDVEAFEKFKKQERAPYKLRMRDAIVGSLLVFIPSMILAIFNKGELSLIGYYIYFGVTAILSVFFVSQIPTLRYLTDNNFVGSAFRRDGSREMQGIIRRVEARS